MSISITAQYIVMLTITAQNSNNVTILKPSVTQFLFSVHPDVLSYTMLYNLLNFPAGVVPVSKVTAEDEEELRHYKGIYQDYWDKVFKQVRNACQ